MQVRTLREHSNAYGSSYGKAVGDTYDHPSPEVLIGRGILAEVKGPKSADTAPAPAKPKAASRKRAPTRRSAKAKTPAATPAPSPAPAGGGQADA